MPHKIKYTTGGFPFNSPIKKDKRITPKMIQQLDDQIAEMKKLGNKGAAQVLLDKKSKLLDKYQQQ